WMFPPSIWNRLYFSWSRTSKMMSCSPCRILSDNSSGVTVFSATFHSSCAIFLHAGIPPGRTIILRSQKPPKQSGLLQGEASLFLFLLNLRQRLGIVDSGVWRNGLG